MTQEVWFEQDDKIVRKRTVDVTPVVESAKSLNRAGIHGFSENRHVGRIPGELLEVWMTEAGIKYSDKSAVQELIRKKMLSNEFNSLRVWEGTY